MTHLAGIISTSAVHVPREGGSVSLNTAGAHCLWLLRAILGGTARVSWCWLLPTWRWALGIHCTRAFPSLTVHLWGTEEVAAWLEHLSLCEYKDIFTRHDIRGSELLHLERRDLKVLHRCLPRTHTCTLHTSFNYVLFPDCVLASLVISFSFCVSQGTQVFAFY